MTLEHDFFKRSTTKRKPVPDGLARHLVSFFGPRQCICGCDAFEEFHHLNDQSWDSDRFENILPVDRNLNWAAYRARQHEFDSQVQIAIAQLELAAVRFQSQAGVPRAYSLAYGCNRMLAYFSEQACNHESEIKYLVACLRNIDRTRDFTPSGFHVMDCLLKDVIAKCVVLFDKDGVSNFVRSSFLDVLSNILHDCCDLKDPSNLDRVRITREKAAQLRRQYEQENPTSMQSRDLELAFAAHLRRDAHVDVIIGQGSTVDDGFSKLKDARGIYSRWAHSEGLSNVMLTEALGEFRRTHSPQVCLECLEELPAHQLQNPWGAAASSTLCARLDAMVASNAKAEKKASQRLVDAFGLYQDSNLPVPRTAMNDAEFLLSPILDKSIFYPHVNKPLAPNVVAVADCFLKTLCTN